VQQANATATLDNGAPSAARVTSPAALEPRETVDLSLWTMVSGAWRSSSFHDFMMYVRAQHGDVVRVNLWPVLPPIYLTMGQAANQGVFSQQDAALEQVLQELINVLPVQANVPSEVDVELQRKVASFFQNGAVVDAQLPSFLENARRMRERWLARPDPAAPVDVFFELSEYVLRTDLEVLYGRSFEQKYGDQIMPGFRQWVENIANGQLVGFFAELGDCLREHIADQRAHPERYADEQSVMRVYLEEGALEQHDADGVVGLLTMTLMAAVFNTQVSLAWILVHLYSQPELLEEARRELQGCADLSDYQQLAQMGFANSCIDESVRLHTMLPGNMVLRKTLADVHLLGVHVPADSLIWLYPNAVHQDESLFPQAASFCPMRLLKPQGQLKRMSDDFELVTFGHGKKRCIGEKMARAMICAFLGETLPHLDARAPTELPADDNLFDLIPASKLQLIDLRARERVEDAERGAGAAAAPY